MGYEVKEEVMGESWVYGWTAGRTPVPYLTEEEQFEGEEKDLCVGHKTPIGLTSTLLGV